LRDLKLLRELGWRNSIMAAKAGILVLKGLGMYLQLTLRLYSKIRYHEQQTSRGLSSLGAVNTEPYYTTVIAKQENGLPIKGAGVKPASNTSTDKCQSLPLPMSEDSGADFGICSITGYIHWDTSLHMTSLPPNVKLLYQIRE
jgi:hypothetical protein